MLKKSIMKRPKLSIHKLRALEVQTSIELAAGGIATAMLLRWLGV